MGLSKLASFQKAIIEDRHVSMHIVLGATKNIYIFIAIPTIALTKKILSSSDPHQLTFYLTYITSDIRGLHFFQKKLQDVLNDYVLGKLASLRKMKPHELTFFDKPDTGPASMEMVPGNCTEWYS